VGTEESSPIIRERIQLLSVSLDIISIDELSEYFFNLLQPPKDNASQPEATNVVLLSLWDFLRARRNVEYRNYVNNAGLVIPISNSLVTGAKFLKGKAPVRYMPFRFFINLLTVLERRECTVYLLGGKDHILKRAENNIRQTFPQLRIVGRLSSPFRKQDEGAIVKAIHKAAPQLLLVGQGVRGEELWIARNHHKLNQGLQLWCSDLFSVFAVHKRRPPEKLFDLGLEAITYCFRNPLKFFRIFLYLYYKFLLLFCKVFKKC
jgi:N-acetylglucosaminyldiphosphoundecaprenol N-acetyl-beta-D-mannosaminyltransferase